MKSLIFSILLLGAVSGTLNAQADPAAVREHLQKFSWMTGDWKGDAWYIGRDQKKNEIKQKEHVVSLLSGAIITMEGTGSIIPDGQSDAKIVFQAFGILTYDLADSKFMIRAYKDGKVTDSDLLENTDGSYSWGLEFPYGKVKYTFRHTEEGIWNEKGEFSRDGGTTWYPTFEMNLVKQN